MKTRVLSALVLLPLAIGLTLAGGTPFLLGVMAMCGLAAWEASALIGGPAGLHEARTWRYLAVGATIVAILGAALQSWRHDAAQMIAALLLVCSLVGLVFGGKPSRRFLEWSCGVAVVAYIAGLGVHFVLLRGVQQGLGWVLLACLVTWSTDSGAYFAGRRFGKRPFFAAISPKKTLEGALGGLLAGSAAAAAVVLAGLHVALPLAPLIGLSVSAMAQLGDLLESLLKREAGVKDSGTLIPGHGGILDRIDSLLFAMTITFYWQMLIAA